MVFGVSLSTYTTIHVIISLIAIAAGFITVFEMIANKPLGLFNTIFLLDHDRHQRDRLRLSVHEHHPGNRRRAYLPGLADGGCFCALFAACPRRVARGLRHQRDRGAVVQRVRADRAGVHEVARPQGAGTQPERTAVLSRKARRRCFSWCWPSSPCGNSGRLRHRPGRRRRQRFTASEPAWRRGSRRSRGRPSCRASRPRRISPAAGTAGISNPPGPRAAPASPTGRCRGR